MCVLFLFYKKQLELRVLELEGQIKIIMNNNTQRKKLRMTQSLL